MRNGCFVVGPRHGTPPPFWLWHTISFYFCLNPCPDANIWPMMGTISSTFQYGLLQSQESPTKGLENVKLSAVKQLSTKLLINQPTYNFYRLFNSMTDEVSFLSSANMSCNKTEPEEQNISFQTRCTRIKMLNAWKVLVNRPSQYLENINRSSWQLNNNHTI